jgi:hypothetical protein
MDGVYNGTQGSVHTVTSENRLTPRLEEVAAAIAGAQKKGMTWRELADWCGLHHGQASGALSNLHRMGVVFVRKGWERERCQVYIHGMYRTSFLDYECADAPVRTKSTQMVQAIIAAAQQVVDDGGLPLSVFQLEQVLNTYKKEMGNNE